MNAEVTCRNVRWLFMVNALTNWIVSVPALINPAAAAVSYGGEPPNYPSIVRLWMGLVFMFGCMFWEVSRDVRGKAALIKYNWIEKTVTATAITSGYFSGDIPFPLVVAVILKNWLWIPLIIWADIAMHRVTRAIDAPRALGAGTA
jgi:hypothetical protein